jgi:hypothetical protein
LTTSGGAPRQARSLVAIVAAIPTLLLACAVALMLGAGIAGRHPMWRTETLNMAEAAAARDVATIAAMLDRGEDPNATRPLRPAFLDGISMDMTPLEAGVAAGRLEVVHLLLARGATVEDGRRLTLACDALHRGYRDIAEFLTGSASSPVCDR